jgi:flagellar hook-associated protein 1 FlgK
MSLQSSLNIGISALGAQSRGLQVTGQNIANANTPGYVREEILFSPIVPEQIGNLIVGRGVDVQAIIQKVDKFLAERLRDATSDVTAAQAERDVYLRLESLLGELTETDLSTGLNQFLASIQEALNQPQSVAMRGLAVRQGQELARSVTDLRRRVDDTRDGLNGRVRDLIGEANRLIEQVAALNSRINDLELAGTSPSQAGALRSQRLKALDDLSKIIDIDVVETESSALNVFLASGQYLVFGNATNRLATSTTIDRNLVVYNVVLERDQSPVALTGGALAGITTARDTNLGAFLDQLDQLAASLIVEFNRIFSSGTGLRGFQDLTGTYAVTDATSALNAAGLAFSPQNGSFQVRVTNRNTGLTETTDLFVDLNGVGAETSLNDLVALIDAVAGLNAQVTPNGELRIAGDAPDLEFSFAGDTSGVLASLGINTFFTGSGSLDIGVNATLVKDPSLFAAGQGGGPGDVSNAIALTDFLKNPVAALGGLTLDQAYEALVIDTTQASASARAIATGMEGFQQTLSDQFLQTTGVSLDEEAIRMISFQQAYQAAARFISTVSELIELLTTL